MDIVAEVSNETVLFEVKYSGQRGGAGDVKGLIEFCSDKSIDRGYVITKEPADFELLTDHSASASILKVPLACLWLSQSS